MRADNMSETVFALRDSGIVVVEHVRFVVRIEGMALSSRMTVSTADG
jgi:hypothetical protein